MKRTDNLSAKLYKKTVVGFKQLKSPMFFKIYQTHAHEDEKIFI